MKNILLIILLLASLETMSQNTFSSNGNAYLGNSGGYVGNALVFNGWGESHYIRAESIGNSDNGNTRLRVHVADDWTYNQGFEILADHYTGQQRSLLYIPGDGSSANFYGGANFGNSVGIGTTNPQGKFHIIGNSGFDVSTKFYLTNGASDFGRTNFVITGRIQDGNDGWNFGSMARNSIVFAANTASSNQNVGSIGTEYYSMQLEGNSKALGFLSSSNGSNPNMVLMQSGSVGVGTANPRSKFDLWNGDLLVTGTDMNGTAYVTSRSGVAYYGNNSFSNGLAIDYYGNIGMGTSTPGPYKLAVEGTIGARKIKITQANPWADYVFDDGYHLRPLTQVENFIKENKHLPEVPTAKEVERNGVDVGETQALLLKKIEELTLYMIEMKKENDNLKNRIIKLEQDAKKP